MKSTFSFLGLFLLLLPLSLSGQPDSLDTFHSIFKELRRDSVLQLTLKTDFKKLVKKKYEEKWQPITLQGQDTLNNPFEYIAKVRTRGNVRKKVCYYPPLKIKFKKDWLAEQGMDTIGNDLKLVVGCKKGSIYSALVLKEYLGYQLYAALTDYSFRTQLAEIEIIDTEDNWKPTKTYAFFIENEDEMAFRFDGRCTKPRIMRSAAIWKEQLATMTLFQYMIGNTDWAFANSHNVRFVRSTGIMRVIPIAYDFDYSGMVNAPYAVHRESLGIEEITQRHFQGRCKNKKAFEAILPLFLEKKEAFYQIVNDFTYLKENQRKNILRYFDDFYSTISNEKQFDRVVMGTCVE